jgi:hypothetical protein
MVETAETVRARRREITRQAQALAKLTGRRRALAVRMAEADAAVLHATRALLDYIELLPDPPVAPLLCGACHLTIPDGDGIPGRHGLSHARCVHAPTNGPQPEDDCA